MSQDETHLPRRSDAKAGGFVGFVPLQYQPEHNDNFDHITAYRVGMGLKLAQVAMKLGATV